MVIDIMEWNGMEWNAAVRINKPKHFNFYRLYYISPWYVLRRVPSRLFLSSPISIVAPSLTVLEESSKNSSRSCRPTIRGDMPR
ncbi:MAG: hypothetical protein EBU66_08550 [Bacteroidetes bacterium]|nr:hypothetical protein [Bacteroidota bacterium]